MLGALVDRRRFLLFGVGGATALALGGCAGSDDGGDESGSGGSTTTAGEPTDDAPDEPDGEGALARPTVRLAFGAFGFPSPFSSFGPPGYVQMSLLYDTLLWKDSTGELLPWLAESVERSDDDLTYTFVLREGITWHDGEPLTADDVVFTFDYYASLDGVPPPVIAQPPQGIASVTAPDASTVEITLTSPDVTFAEQVAGVLPILPRHIWESITDPAAEQDVAILVGSGPYRLDSAYEGDGSPLLYTANDDYFLGVPFVERIEFSPAEDQFAALLAGTADAGVGSGVRDDILAPFVDDDDYEIITTQGATTAGLYFNLTQGGALADAEFRRACALAIDRADLVDRLADGNGQPGNPGFLGAENPFLVEVEQYEYDVEAANAALDAAGYERDGDGPRQGPDGEELGFDLLVGTGDAPLAEVIAAALGELGVSTTIMAVEPGPQLFGAKFSGQYQLAILGFPGPSAGSLNGDPDLLRRVFSSEAPPSLTSATGYVNADFDELAARQQVTFDESERADIVAEMQEIIAADIPILSLYSPDTTFVFRPDVLEEWYLSPSRYPSDIHNKQLFVTGLAVGTEIRPTE